MKPILGVLLCVAVLALAVTVGGQTASDQEDTARWFASPAKAGRILAGLDILMGGLETRVLTVSDFNRAGRLLGCPRDTAVTGDSVRNAWAGLQSCLREAWR